jgi:hypothetical protein
VGTTTLYRLVQQHRPLTGEPSQMLLAEEPDRDRALALFADVLAELSAWYGPFSWSRLVLQPATAARS